MIRGPFSMIIRTHFVDHPHRHTHGAAGSFLCSTLPQEGHDRCHIGTDAFLIPEFLDLLLKCFNFSSIVLDAIVSSLQGKRRAFHITQCLFQLINLCFKFSSRHLHPTSHRSTRSTESQSMPILQEYKLNREISCLP